MNEHELFSHSMYEVQTQLAERELSAFTRAAVDLFGPELASPATEDWLEEAELIDTAPLSIGRNWRSVTIAASARLSDRIDLPQHSQVSLSTSSDTKVSPIPSSP
jgi:hypothetical protein